MKHEKAGILIRNIRDILSDDKHDCMYATCRKK